MLSAYFNLNKWASARHGEFEDTYFVTVKITLGNFFHNKNYTKGYSIFIALIDNNPNHTLLEVNQAIAILEVFREYLNTIECPVMRWLLLTQDEVLDLSRLPVPEFVFVPFYLERRENDE